MKRKFITIALLLLVAISSCKQDDKEDLIEGFRLTGDPDLDLLVLLAASGGGGCSGISESNKSFTYSNDPVTICSNNEISATFRVSTTGKYTVTATKGTQTLSSDRCSSRTFFFNVSLSDNGTKLIDSEGGTKTLSLSLDSSKEYVIVPGSLVSPSSFSCAGFPPSSNVSNYTIKFTKE